MCDVWRRAGEERGREQRKWKMEQATVAASNYLAAFIQEISRVHIDGHILLEKIA
jgi:hypothetical protein